MVSVQAGQGGAVVFAEEIIYDEEMDAVMLRFEYCGRRVLVVADASTVRDLLKIQESSWALDPF